MRLGSLAVTGFFFAAATLTVPAVAADEDQKARFMAACLKDGKRHICECTYEALLTMMTKREIELQIAFMGGDKVRQEEIKSDPTFDYKAYNAKGLSGLTRTLACVRNRRK